MNSLTSLDTTWLLLCAFLVMIMQAGFCLFESGLVRSKNNTNVAFKNLSDFSIAAIVYWMLGFGLMYGNSVSGLIGSSRFFYEAHDQSGAWFLFQLMFCGATATIVGGALAERTSFSAYLIISVLIAAILYPIPGHWIWGGVMQDVSAETTLGWLASLGFIDFAGGAAVHLLGGMLALVAVIIVGPRLGRFAKVEEGQVEDTDKDNNLKSKNNDKSSGLLAINASNYPMATVGVMLLWFGWFGFNTGSAIGDAHNLAAIAINTALAAAAGSVALIVWSIFRTRKPDIGSALNGTLAGLVGITAGAHLYSTVDAVLVGIFSAVAMYCATLLLEKYEIDDVVSAFPVHGVAGIVGILLVAILGDSAMFPNGNTYLVQFGVQLLGAGAVVTWSLVVGFALFFVANKILPMRVSNAHEIEGLNTAEHGAASEVQDLLGSMMRQRYEGDFTKKVDVEPHTEVGQIANEYNKVLERIRLEIKTREKAYDQLKKASHFQYIFENSNEGIIQFSMQGDIQTANSAAANILGYASVDRLISTLGNCMESLEFVTPGEHTRLFSQFKKQGQLHNAEMVFVREVDNKQGVALCSMRSIAGNEEQAACVLASFTDVSERKEIEQLKVANRAAAAASLAKSQFLANMSHEIRTPLNGVTGMLELLKRTDLELHQQRYIDIAQNSAQSLLSVINDILDFSKIEAGKLELQSVDFPLRETLADVVDIFASQTASKNVELIGHISPDLPGWVVGDPERLRQVLINILGNAVKFTEKGTISLSAVCKKRSNNIVVLQLKIRDTGCGISEENLEKLFDSFTQADASTTRKYGGTGLGLTISRQLISLMKGRINVVSKIGVGSEVTIDLALPQSTKTIGYQSALPPGLSGMRVLIVDDHPVNLELTSELLAPFGLQIDCAESAAEALKLHNNAVDQNRPYELFLFDYHMPETDGAQLADLIRQTAAGQIAKMILLTSIDQVSPNDPEMSSFNTLLVKPVRASRLFESIAAVMANRLNTDTTAATNSVNELAARAVNFDAAAKTRILLVEDNMVNQIVATEILEQAGYMIEAANNGQEAVDRLFNNDSDGIDIVLMDCQMPVLDGFEASRIIRKRENEKNLPSVPIIALTANALKGDKERCLKAGMSDYITKPIDVDALNALLAKYINDDDSSVLQKTGS